MALVVDDFFAVLGKYVKTVNVFDGLLSTVATGQTDIENILETNNLTRLFANIPGMFTGFQNNIVNWMSATNRLVSEVITDRDFVREGIPVQGDDLNSILLALIEYMNDNSDDVNDSVIAIGSITDNITSTIIGDWIINTKLDGITPPIPGGLASKEYKNLTSELAVTTDTIYCQCISKPADGSEQWKLFATAAKTGGYEIQGESPGDGPSFNTANTSSGGISVANGDFETFTTTNEPDGWTMAGGSGGTDYFEENAAGFIFRGSSSLQINNSGVSLKQQIHNIIHDKLYMLSVQGIRDDTDTAGTTLDVVLSVEDSSGGDVYFTNTTQVVVPSAGDLKKPIFLHWYLDSAKDNKDVYVKILINNFSGTPPAKFIYLDEVLVSVPVYYNGINFSILRGEVEFEVGDRFQSTITNNDDGVFQTYFRKVYGVQLPSTSGTPSQLDSLAI